MTDRADRLTIPTGLSNASRPEAPLPIPRHPEPPLPRHPEWSVHRTLSHGGAAPLVILSREATDLLVRATVPPLKEPASQRPHRTPWLGQSTESQRRISCRSSHRPHHDGPGQEWLDNPLFDKPGRAPDTGIVKICGLQRQADVEAAMAAGADLLGFVFAPSRRQVDAKTVAAITAVAGDDGARPPLVGVFVNASERDLNRAADEAGLGYLQLHGDEPPELLNQLERPVIKSFSAAPTDSLASLAQRIEPYFATENPPAFVLIDSFHPDQRGGTGIEANWEIAAELAARFPLLLAGGLTPDNVSGAIAQVAPRGVDVSSGVEREGAKDPVRIRAFVEESRAGFGSIANRSGG